MPNGCSSGDSPDSAWRIEPSSRNLVSARSGALVAQARPDAADDAREVRLGAHDRVEVLVGGRGFVAQGVGEAMIEPDGAELGRDCARRDFSASFGAAEAAARAVRAGGEGGGEASARDVIAG